MPENLELHELVDDGSTIIDNNDLRNKLWLKKLSCSCPYLGIILATFSSLFFSLCSVIVKGLVDINPIELAAFRFVGVLLPALPIVIYCQEPVFPKGKRIMLILRCFMGTTGLMLSFYAFRHMPLADASVIIFSTPVFVAIFARIFLKESCGIFNVFTIILTLIGVILITRPPFIFGDIAPSLGDHNNSDSSDETMASTEDNQFIKMMNININQFEYDSHHYHFHYPSSTKTSSGENVSTLSQNNALWGPVAAISSTLFGANVYVLLRALKGLHFSVIMTNFGCFALIYTLLICWLINALCWPKCDGYDRILVIVLGIFSFLGQILLTLSLQMEQAGPVAIARCADIVFAFIWQVIFFNETPNGYSIFGALLVISSVILTALKKWVISLPRESDLRRNLRCLAFE